MQSRRGSNEMSPSVNANDVRHTITSSDDENAPMQRIKKRLQQFSDSDSDIENLQPKKTVQEDELQNVSDSEKESIIVPFKNSKIRSRIQIDGSSSDSDTTQNEEQQMRMKNKRNKLKDKFKGLLSSRGKHTILEDNSDKQSSEGSHGEVSDPSDNEMSSITKIKQVICSLTFRYL